MAPESIQKALGFSLKVDGVSRLRKMSKKHWSQTISGHAKKLIKIPYKQGGPAAVPSNIIVHRPSIIVQEMNIVPSLDEDGTEFNSQNLNIIVLGR